MKICIETIYDGYNYGCFLQAYALQSFLKEKGYEVVLLDHSTFKSRIVRRYFAKSIKRTILKIKRYRVFHKSWQRLIIERFDKKSNYDLTIIGSDEVWNIENNSFDHRSQFYGIDCNSKRVITYGPSLGFSTYESYNNYPLLVDSIKNRISSYCVRDSFTESFLNKIGINDIKRVADPTILYYKSWNELRGHTSIESDYLIYYSYLDNTPFKEHILKFAKGKKLRIVTVGFDYAWCDESIIVNPFEFLDLMANAKYIVTSTFHGSVFSILFKKQFVVVHPNAKVIELLKHFDLSVLAPDECSSDSFSEILNTPIDYKVIGDRIDADQRESERILGMIIKQ